MSVVQRRRFWRAAEVRPEAAGFGVALDARPLRTPAQLPFAVPSRALAEAVAAEWNAVVGEVRPEALPLTRAVNSSIDRVAPAPEPVVAMIADYAETDLICYRAGEPEALRRRQAQAWDPLLAWAERALAARLVAVTGVVPQPQPAASVAALRAAVAAHDPFRLTGLLELVALSGSLVIGLAVSRGALAGAEAWPLTRIDETWQAEQWGWDAEAAAAEAARRRSFLGAETYLRLLDG